MTKEDYLNLGIKKRHNEISDKSWNDLVRENSLPFKNGDCFRKWVSRHVDIKEEITTTSDAFLNIQKEKIKIRDERTLLNQLIREDARFDNIVEQFVNAIKTSSLENFEYKPNKIVSNSKFTVSVWADFHVGAKFDNYWGKYDIAVFRKRFFDYINKIIDISKFHNSKDLVILGLADYVNGLIHPSLRITNECDVVSQTQLAAETMAEGLDILHEHFNTIDFYSVIGNHDRVNARKEDSLYIENFARFIPFYLKARCVNLKNVIIHDNDIDNGIVVAKKNDLNLVGVHGDKDSMNRVLSDLSLMLKIIPDTIYLAHNHHFSVDSQKSVRIIMSGSMVGTDDYAKDIRKTGYASQALTIYNGNKLECIYDIELN